VLGGDVSVTLVALMAVVVVEEEEEEEEERCISHSLLILTLNS